MGRYREAQVHLAESLAIAREIGDTRMIARVLQPLGMASLGQGDVAAARGYLQEALALARKLGDKRELAGAINALAQLHRIQGDLETAEPLYDQVVALARELGDREIIAIGLLNLAMASLGRGARTIAPGRFCSRRWPSPRRLARGRRVKAWSKSCRPRRVTTGMGAVRTLLRRRRSANLVHGNSA